FAYVVENRDGQLKLTPFVSYYIEKLASNEISKEEKESLLSGIDKLISEKWQNEILDGILPYLNATLTKQVNENFSKDIFRYLSKQIKTKEQLVGVFNALPDNQRMPFINS